jgi:hypothetical protein
MFWGDGESMDIATNVYQYYRHRALKTSDKITRGILVDPGDLYFSAGNLIYSRIINRNIAVVKYVPNIREIPWREDVSHLDPIIDYDKITERYRQS